MKKDQENCQTWTVVGTHTMAQRRPLAVTWSFSCDEHHPYDRDDSTQNSTSDTTLDL